MAKITITITDNLDGTVAVVADPKFSEMARMINSGEQATAAHGFALLALRAIREESQRPGKLKIHLPRVSGSGRIIK